MNKWIINLVLIPLFVGLIVAIFSFILPKIFSEKKEISYSLEASGSLFSSVDAPDIDLKINDVLTNELYLSKVRIWNSGKIPIKDLQVLLRFEISTEDFKILGSNHKTIPEFEFGDIIEEIIDSISMRIKFPLLNPQDEDLVSIFANQESTINLYVKSENMKVRFKDPNRDIFSSSTKALLAGIIGLIASFMSSLIYKILNKRQGPTIEDLSKLLIKQDNDT